MPRFLLQIVEADGAAQLVVARLHGGGALERDLIETFTTAIVAKGVGLFKTEAQVTAAIRDGITEAITVLKHATIPIA